MLRTRVLSAVVLVVLLGAGLYIGGLLWWVLLLFISLIGYHEFCMAVRKPSDPKSTSGKSRVHEIISPEIIGYLCTILYYGIILINRDMNNIVYIIVFTMILYMVSFVAHFPEYDNAFIIRCFFGFLYIPFMISFLYLLRIRKNGFVEILLVIIASWICDTFAYFTGMAFGKHKLAPVLSPKKSVEGAVGGTLFSMLFGGILACLTQGGIGIYVTVAGAGAVVSQFGDLFASGIKRNQGIKDYGNLIPGHGGILDRFDSVIITAPVIYILCSVLIKGGEL